MVVMEMYTGRPTLTDALNDMDWDVRKYVKTKTASTRNKNWAWVILGKQRTWSMRQHLLTPAYTTRWDEMPLARA